MTLPPARVMAGLSLFWVVFRTFAVAICWALLAFARVAAAALSWTMTVTGLLASIAGPNWGSILLTSSLVNCRLPVGDAAIVAAGSALPSSNAVAPTAVSSLRFMCLPSGNA